MNCPRCKDPLEAQLQAGMEVDRCSGCAGVWLDKGESEALSRPEMLKVAAQVAGLDTHTAVDESDPLTCPRCQGIMQREHYAKSGVEIDRCDCGVWLDKGELEKIALYRTRCVETLSKAAASTEHEGDFAFAPDELERSFARLYFRLGNSE